LPRNFDRRPLRHLEIEEAYANGFREIQLIGKPLHES